MSKNGKITQIIGAVVDVSFENDIIEKIKSEKPEIIDAIQSSGKLEENTEKLLVQAIEEYKKANK